MRLGVHLPVAGKGASPETILQVAVEAERVGLDSVWSWERLMRPTVPIRLGGAGGPIMDAPEMFGIVYGAVQGSRSTSWPCEPSGVRILSASRAVSTASRRLTSAQNRYGRAALD